MTPESAEAWAIVIKAVEPLFDRHHSHVERVNEQNRKAARPMYWIASVAVVAVAGVALWATIVRGDSQLARDLLLPLLSFAGGLGIGRVATASK
jgi:hypothetical protein